MRRIAALLFVAALIVATSAAAQHPRTFKAKGATASLAQ